MRLFLKLGFIAFGGPAAHIALLQQEVVQKRKWVEQSHFLDLVGATNLIPGPNSTEMVMHCGYERGGRSGMVVAGISFILPAVTITAILAWLYANYGQLPELEPFLYGIKPAVLAIIFSAAYSLAKTALKNKELAVLGLIVLVACVAGLNEIIALFGAGIIGLLLYALRRPSGMNSIFPFFFLQVLQPVMNIDNTKIFFSFLKIGAILYGSGYVLFGFIDAEMVSKGWLSRQVLIDAVAAGQFTPGPVLSTATFIGWQLNGWQGAILATIGIFLPSFLFVALLNPLVPKIRKSGWISAFLDAVNIASVAIIFAVGIEMSVETLTNLRMIMIAVISTLILFRFPKFNSAYIIAGGALLGYILHNFNI